MYGFPEKKLAIIVLNLNGFAITNDCIQSLYTAGNIAFDIILVDNGSTDGSGRRLKALYPEVVLLESTINAGFTGGNNLGLRYVLEREYKYVLLLNNDAFVAPHFLEPLVGLMDSRT